MPGLLVDVAVQVGQKVQAGERVAVIEAMKMENVLFAAADGVLTFKERLALVNPTVAPTFADDGTGIGFSGVAVDSSSTLLFIRVGVDRERSMQNLCSFERVPVMEFVGLIPREPVAIDIPVNLLPCLLDARPKAPLTWAS
jgi:hypothetical protein